MTTHLTGEAETNANANALLVGRLERIPVTKRLLWIRVIIGSATFFDAYTVLVIAFAMPSLVEEWSLTPAWVGLILSAGYAGQLIGAVLFGWVAEKIGRLPTLLITILLFVSMDIACLFAWSGASMLIFRFLQGIGTGGEVQHQPLLLVGGQQHTGNLVTPCDRRVTRGRMGGDVTVGSLASVNCRSAIWAVASCIATRSGSKSLYVRPRSTSWLASRRWLMRIFSASVSPRPRRSRPSATRSPSVP